MYIETHAHLTDPSFDTDREEVLARARSVGVAGFVEIAEQQSQWDKARAFSEAHSDVYWAVGLHPYYAIQVDGGFLKRLEEVLGHPRCVAVGEIGLDYHREDSSRDAQRRALGELLSLAVHHRKPVVLHCREAHPLATEAQQDLLALLRSVHGSGSGSAPRGVAHCFQGTEETAQALLEMGYQLGVDGPLTYPTAGRLRSLVLTLPLSSLVLETDSPYLPPQSHRGKRNEPAHIPALARALADLKKIPLETVAAQTTANALGLFRLPPIFH